MRFRDLRKGDRFRFADDADGAAVMVKVSSRQYVTTWWPASEREPGRKRTVRTINVEVVAVERERVEAQS